MLRFGPDSGAIAVLALPLFEEANRTRAFAVTLLRALAERDIGGALPDLPGQGESLIPTREATLHGWRAALASAVAGIASRRPVHVLSLRSGALLTHDAVARSRWQLSPVDGTAIVRDLLRAETVGSGRRPDDTRPIDEPGPPLLLAGNEIDRATLRALRDAAPDRAAPGRLVRLGSDPLPADRHITGAPVWRRAEPGNEPALAMLLADDVADWIGRCGG